MLAIICFHKLSWIAHGYKLKTTYVHVTSYFYKLSQKVSQIFISADKLKLTNPYRSEICSVYYI
jgi:hypothetical protein